MLQDGGNRGPFPSDKLRNSAGACWVCGAESLVRVHEGHLPAILTSHNFQITNKQYGRMGALDRCGACGFHQCTNLANVLDYYIEMEDHQYEATRQSRALQQIGILRQIPTNLRRGRLLDIGAGSGILIEQARGMGFEAEGVEPSIELQAHAKKLHLNVHLGVLPHPDVRGPFDVITMVDVIEHVPDPVGLLCQARDLLAPKGMLLVATPDRRSVVARLMGWNWWHYRIAHIGYFDRSTLREAISRAGFELSALKRPGWRFPASYLVERTMCYVPPKLRLNPPAFLDRVIIPLNLRDSMLAICRRIA
jgi:SAM-dependent methyltransferase